MEYDYIISLKRPSFKIINLISVLLLVIFLAAFGLHIAHTGIEKRNAALLGIPVIIIGLMLNGFLRRNQKDFMVYYRTELFIAALGWFLLPLFRDLWYLGILYAVMGFIERLVKKPDEWSFSKEGVVRNSLPKKQYEWVEIDNVILRDNLFTMDLRSNHIIQKELETPVDKALQDEFNEYCRKQLHFQK